jgi:hypothetical protein
VAAQFQTATAQAVQTRTAATATAAWAQTAVAGTQTAAAGFAAQTVTAQAVITAQAGATATALARAQLTQTALANGLAGTATAIGTQYAQGTRAAGTATAVARDVQATAAAQATIDWLWLQATPAFAATQTALAGPTQTAVAAPTQTAVAGAVQTAEAVATAFHGGDPAPAVTATQQAVVATAAAGTATRVAQLQPTAVAATVTRAAQVALTVTPFAAITPGLAATAGPSNVATVAVTPEATVGGVTQVSDKVGTTWLERIWQSLDGIRRDIARLPGDIAGRIRDVLVTVFVPRPEFIETQVTDLRTTVEARVPFMIPMGQVFGSLLACFTPGECGRFAGITVPLGSDDISITVPDPAFTREWWCPFGPPLIRAATWVWGLWAVFKKVRRIFE